MIQVTIQKDKIKVQGHSGYDELGKDIVCSSVSSIVITSVNAIIRLENDTIHYETKEGFIEIMILKHTEITDTLILNMVDLLKELEKKYKKYIKIQ